MFISSMQVMQVNVWKEIKPVLQKCDKSLEFMHVIEASRVTVRGSVGQEMTL